MNNRITTTDENGYEYYYDGACPSMFLAGEQRVIMIEDDSYNTVATFEYDALGRRIEKYDSAASESTYYYYNDKWQVLCEHDGSSYGNTYVYGNYVDEVLYSLGDGEYYYAHNHLFSPVALLDGNGNIAERYEYNAYGKVQVLTDSDGDGNWFDDAGDVVYGSSQVGNPYLFTGRRLDVLDSGDYEIMYYRNRYYNTYTGRFLTQDPLGINPAGFEINPFKVVKQYNDGINLYEYTQTDPIKNLDYNGLIKLAGITEYRVSAWIGVPHAGFLGMGDIDYGPAVTSPISMGVCPWSGGGPNPSGTYHWLLKIKQTGEMVTATGTKRCCKNVTQSEAKSCVNSYCMDWNGTIYSLVGHNCQSFVSTAKSNCCLARF